MDLYRSITYLQKKGEKPQILDKRYFNLRFEVDDVDSFVYTQTQRVSRNGKPIETQERRIKVINHAKK